MIRGQKTRDHIDPDHTLEKMLKGKGIMMCYTEVMKEVAMMFTTKE